MKNNVVINALSMTSLLLIAVSALLFLFQLKPNVVIRNNTGKIIHIYAMERDSSSDEPGVQEVEQLKKVRVVKPDGELTITPSLGSLLKKDIALDIGWRIDGLTESPLAVAHKGFRWIPKTVRVIMLFT